MRLSTTQRFRWGLYGATALAGLIVAIGVVNTLELTRRSDDVFRSASIVSELEVLQRQVTDAETGQRGYLLTQNRRYLEPYEEAPPAINGHLARLAELLADEPGQRAALDSLRPLVQDKLDELHRTLVADSAEGNATARALVSRGGGKAAMDSIRAVVAHMLHREQASLSKRTDEHRRTAALSEVVLLAVLGLVGVLCLLGRRVVDRDDKQRTAATAEILRLRDLAEEETARSEEETARAEDEAARAEEFATQAEESRERLEEVLAGISDGFLVMDRDLTILYINAQGAEMVGRPVAELLQQALWTALPAGRGSPLDLAFRDALATRDVVRLEAPLPGTDRRLAAHVYPAGDNLSVFFQDVTGRVAAERRAQEGDERLRVALEAGRFGVWEWDIGDGQVTWSDRTYELHGVPLGGFGGRLDDFTRLVHADDLDRVGGLIQSAIRDRLPYEVEFRVVHPDGSVHWLATAGRVLYRDDGTPDRMLGVTWERTQQRLEEESARHAQRMESIGRLAGGVAHEVNNQMSVVLGFAQFILKRADLAADLRSDVTEIHRAGERSAAITSQLLAFSRRQLLRPELLDLSDVVSRFERVIKRTVGERCDLTLQLGAGLAHVEADRGQVEQVLLNLALNAADAMPDGGTLAITTRDAELPRDSGALGAGVAVVGGRYVRLTVTDSGHGMDAGVLRHVFEPFFTTKPLGKGTGLGLSTVYGIVKQSGGYVWVDSAPGAGTSVHVDFPVVKVRPRTDVPEPAMRTTPARGLVMVVEDEPAVRMMVSRVLEQEGYEVLATQHGQEALAALEGRDGIRLVVSDVAMPVMSGRELGDMLARTHPDLPVLYMSGFADDEIISRGLLEPGRPFIQKPFASELFAQRVAELLQQLGR